MSEKKSINELIDLLFSTSRLLKDKVRCQHGCAHLSLVNMSVIRYVEEQGSPTMKEIADHLAISAPSATSMVENLIKSNYLKRTADEADRRVIRISLTKTGKAEFEKILASAKEKLSEVLNNLKKEDLESLTKIFVELNKHLNA